MTDCFFVHWCCFASIIVPRQSPYISKEKNLVRQQNMNVCRTSSALNILCLGKDRSSAMGVQSTMDSIASTSG